MKDNNIDEETARNMYSQTRMMLNKEKKIGEMIDDKKK